MPKFRHGSDCAFRGSHELGFKSSRLSLRERACFRGAKDDKKTPRASTPATLNCNLLLNHAHNSFKIQTRLNARILCTHRTLVNMGDWGKKLPENCTPDYPTSN